MDAALLPFPVRQRLARAARERRDWFAEVQRWMENQGVSRTDPLYQAVMMGWNASERLATQATRLVAPSYQQLKLPYPTTPVPAAAPPREAPRHGKASSTPANARRGRQATVPAAVMLETRAQGPSQLLFDAVRDGVRDRLLSEPGAVARAPAGPRRVREVRV